MSLTFQSQQVFYVDFTELGTLATDTFSDSTKNFNTSELFNNASQFIVAIERFNIPTSTISMQKAQLQFLQLRNKIGGALTDFNLTESFSLLEFFQQLNTFDATLTFSLTSDLRMSILGTNWDNQELLLSDNARCIFDMPAIVGANPVVGTATIRGASPVADAFDRLKEIELISGESLLQQQQEIRSSQDLRFLLTDFLLPNPYNTSFAFEEEKAPTGAFTLSYPTRQDIQYFAGDGARRPIMMKGKSPISNIKVEAIAVVKDPDPALGLVRERIRINPCGVFNVKMGFYLKGST